MKWSDFSLHPHREIEIPIPRIVSVSERQMAVEVRGVGPFRERDPPGLTLHGAYEASSRIAYPLEISFTPTHMKWHGVAGDEIDGTRLEILRWILKEIFIDATQFTFQRYIAVLQVVGGTNWKGCKKRR